MLRGGGLINDRTRFEKRIPQKRERFSVTLFFFFRYYCLKYIILRIKSYNPNISLLRHHILTIGITQLLLTFFTNNINLKNYTVVHWALFEFFFFFENTTILFIFFNFQNIYTVSRSTVFTEAVPPGLCHCTSGWLIPVSIPNRNIWDM